jgi:hypothetical protein
MFAEKKFPNICNHCRLEQMKADAVKIGHKIVLRPDDRGGVGIFSMPVGAYESPRESDRVGHLGSVQDHCTC